MKGSWCLLVFVILLVSSDLSARTWYITPDGSGDAPTIQSGVDSAAAGDTVLVACGTYYDCSYVGPSGVKACVNMKSGITLRGELGNPTCAVIDAQQQGRVFVCDSVAGAVIECVTATGGLAPNGAGMICQDSEMIVADVVFSENAAAGRGGGLQVLGGIALTVTGCTFSGNTSGSSGAGVYVKGSISQVTLESCDFFSNQANGAGGGVYCSHSGRLDLVDCWLEGNTASDGGGLAYCSWGEVGRVTRCVFAYNWSWCGPWPAGAIYQDGGSVWLQASTLHGNRGNAIVIWAESFMDINHTIIANSTQAAVRLIYDEYNPWTYAECCDFHGNVGGDWGPDMSNQLGVRGNISACPSFCYAGGGDFQLCDESPCLPGNHPDGYDCGLIGALGEGCSCGPTAIEQTSWGIIKAMYR